MHVQLYQDTGKNSFFEIPSSVRAVRSELQRVPDTSQRDWQVSPHIHIVSTALGVAQAFRHYVQMT